MTALAAAPGSPQPRRIGTIARCAVEEIGMNSVSPWTRPRTIASMMDMAPQRKGAECWVLSAESENGCLDSALSTLHSALGFDLHLPDDRQDHRSPSHCFAEVAFEQRANFFLGKVGI